MTAPESSPKPAEAAIAEKYASRHAFEKTAQWYEIRDDFLAAIQEAAIQRGDGQTDDVPASAIRSAGQFARDVLPTPPAPKPNETSGATPRTDAYFKAESEADEESNLPTHREFMEALELELQHEKSFGSNLRFEAERDAARAVAEVRRQEISELRAELAAVRAAGAEAPVEFVEVGLDGRKIPHTTDAKVWASEFVKTITANPSIASDVDTMLGWFANAMCAQMDESERRHAAKSTPGVDAALRALRDDDRLFVARDIRDYKSDSSKIAYVHGWNDALAELQLKLRAVKQEGQA